MVDGRADDIRALSSKGARAARGWVDGMDPRIAALKREYADWSWRVSAAELARRWAYVQSLPWTTGKETTLECYVVMTCELPSGLELYMRAVMSGVPGDASILTAEEERVLSAAVVGVGAAGRPHTWTAGDRDKLRAILGGLISR